MTFACGWLVGVDYKEWEHQGGDRLQAARSPGGAGVSWGVGGEDILVPMG